MEHVPSRPFKSRSLALAAATLFSAAALAPHGHAQTPSDGWVALESLNETAAPSPASNNGWVALDELPSSGSEISSSPLAAPNTPDNSWTSIDDDLSAVTASMALTDGRLNAGDLVDISVAQDDDLGGAYRISSLGTLVLPLIGSVDAAGLSPQELEEKLEQLYGIDYFVNPEITVSSREKIIGAVEIKGLINRPGAVSLTTVESLADILMKGGGVSGARSELDAIILRDIGIGIKARRVSLAAISANGEPGPTILPGDDITILKRETLPTIKDDSGQFPLLDMVLNGGSLPNF